ncbi:replication initiator [Krasilnikovia sp. MM14-A1004]|uniref:replication initiator n=1 Tax=Krasilnikovia sp. MM14-A1004 TaxID=3373541 RepID=UPI00399D54A6
MRPPPRAHPRTTRSWAPRRPEHLRLLARGVGRTVHFPRLLDRFFQNLRRTVGCNVQYAGCVEPQPRLAPHAHCAGAGCTRRPPAASAAAAPRVPPLAGGPGGRCHR